ncbi:hypothetical protein [Streptomyces qinglanensis]|uniref:Uncharacterized protein n=1 Tax=Streptomyces qinglanensis TaxID=943816 RepID=A0A1H9VBL0_9ACTN|nr:hypothetical protein [Streptomyces qinglanensis]SES19065.1 hypothetical protein SAMN05421870_111126 [Streptomyces qinglanensis]
MSYPPPPGQQPNPYATPQQGSQGAPYGYPGQGAGQPGYAQPGYNQPGYGYPGGVPPYPGGPGGGIQPTVSMPGQVVTARVLLFVAGSFWALLAVIVFFVGLVANDAVSDIPGVDAAGGAALGAAFIGLLIFGGLAALHIVPASMFGKGRIGTRVTAIIAASVNALLPLLLCFGALGSAVGGEDAASMFFWYILWLATAVLTLVFCCLSPASQWFNRPQY